MRPMVGRANFRRTYGCGGRGRRAGCRGGVLPFRPRNKPNSEYGLPVGYLNHVITLLKLTLVSWNVNDKYKSNILMSLGIVNIFNKSSTRFIVTFTVLDVL